MRTHQRQSTAVSLCTNGLGWRESRSHRGPTAKALAQLGDRRSFCNISDFPQKVVRQRHTGEGSSRLQLAVQIVRNMAQLNHRWHVDSIDACASHVNVQALGAARLLVEFVALASVEAGPLESQSST